MRADDDDAAAHWQEIRSWDAAMEGKPGQVPGIQPTSICLGKELTTAGWGCWTILGMRRTIIVCLLSKGSLAPKKINHHLSSWNILVAKEKKKGQTTQRYKRLESRGANELPTQQLISISFSASTLNTSKQVSISQNATRQTSQTRLATTLPQACKALRLFLPKSRPSVNQIMQLLSRHKCALNTHTRTHARAYIPCHLVVILAVIVWPFRFWPLSLFLCLLPTLVFVAIVEIKWTL